MTVNCARCHDHKVDPIPQKDYYRLLASFKTLWTQRQNLKKVDEQTAGESRSCASGAGPRRDSRPVARQPERAW